MSKISFVCITLLFGFNFAVSANEFEQYLSQQNSAYLTDDITFEKQKEKEKQAFERYRQQVLKAYRQYKKQIAAYWGEDNTVVSSNRNWAEYHNKLTERHVVDFEKGQVKVEVILNESEINNKRLIQAKLNKAVVQTVTTSGDHRSILEVAKKPSVDVKQKKTGAAILKDQVKAKKND